MHNLPESFLQTMKDMLKEEYPQFLRGYDNPRQHGLRVNTGKISLEQFEKIAPFHLKRIPWIPGGYYYQEGDHPARHPFYAAGLYYLQEPSAMTPASRLPVEPGDRVLDLCAAPGGKATALGTALRGQGLLVANDINKARARALLRNIELFGLANVFVTNETPKRLAERFPAYFDKIMVDAPCSGEGMFRKNPAVTEAWQEKGPDYFSGLQREIILQAFDMLKPGGRMLYSTCTFSPLENEGVITYLLACRPKARLVPMEDYEGFGEGLTEALGRSFDPSCRLARRIWPHRMAGEGHFMALLAKEEGAVGALAPAAPDTQTSEEKPSGILIKKSGKNSDKKRKHRKKICGGAGSAAASDHRERALLQEFLSRCSYPFDRDRLEIRREKGGDTARVYYVPNPSFEGLGIRFLRNGVYLGDLKKNRFEPAEPLALLLSGTQFGDCLDFDPEDPRLRRYLAGESFALTEQEAGQKNGWKLILAGGYPLGFAKQTGKILKNKYPPGWRSKV